MDICLHMAWFGLRAWVYRLRGIISYPGGERLRRYFGLSYASWLTLPRVLMEDMPDEWQEQMALLLEQYEAAYPNQPDVGTRVQVTDMHGKLIPTPGWLIDYRHPDSVRLEELRARGGI